MLEKTIHDRWLRLDNAGKIYPAFASKRDPATFRVAVVLKRDVIGECLQRALEETLRDFPSMDLTLRRGLFWAYLDESHHTPKVLEEKKMPCTYIDMHHSKGHLFQVYYYNKRISLECFHALTDGYGALEFLKAILYNYLKQIYNVDPGDLRLHGLDMGDVEDSYKKYTSDFFTSGKSVRAAHIKGTPTRLEGAFVHHGIVSASGLKAVAKSYNTTITVLLTAIYGKTLIHEIQKSPVVVTVPINLRKMFPSSSLRNFSYVMNVVIEKDLSFDEIVTSVHKQFQEQVNEESLRGQFSKNVNFEEHFILRVMPNVVKSLILKQVRQFKSKKIVTSILTNPGIVKLPESMKEHVEHFETVLYASKPHYINMGVSTYDDKLVYALSRGIEETDIIDSFYENMVEITGLEIKRFSNVGD
ncbi:hypothetical protein EZV73_18830 [Acidaminobacter sp. JC074]|uniref:hypothetical protein n=1 Tax=Acidaminobacter sp. JC074 TaxID=2530199 RepID=UPI001F0D0929|nr:hypothetical protein [Acidaminobacter sp. JC074]MCH4889645.1 hypothetical protein [Acidaminobacter sp. JC074]